MSALPTCIEMEAGRPLTPLQIFDITAAQETTLSRLLMHYIGTGLVFMLLPGKFLGYGICWRSVVITRQILCPSDGFRTTAMLRSDVFVAVPAALVPAR